MRSDLHLLLNAHLAEIQGVRLGGGLFVQPAGGPADKVGGRERRLFLQIDGGYAADLEMMRLCSMFSP